jgi:endonuclease G, mitochondrial
MNVNRVDKLRAMLAQVDPTGIGSTARSNLESRAAGALAGPKLDVRRTNTEALEATMALESLDVVRRGSAIDSEQQFALEAIVMPLYRPVIDVINDYIVTDQLTTTWKMLGEESRRQWTTDRILAVGRIEVPGIMYAGTGFIVGSNLLMTNRHVAVFFAQGLGRRVDFQPGQTAEIDFYHEKGVPKTEVLTVQKVVMIHPWWDMALLQVSGLPSNRRPLTLSTADPEMLKDRRVVVIGYPGQDFNGDQDHQRVQSRIFRDTYYVKRFQPGLFRVRQNIESYQRQVSAVTHDCSTLGGNSGSAVIDVESGHVVGLHFAGSYLEANYAVSPFDLAQDSRVVDAGVNFAGRLDPRGDFYGTSWSAADAGTSAEVGQGASMQQSIPKISPAVAPPVPAQSSITSTAQVSTTGNTATVVIPLMVSISLGTPMPATAPVTPPALAAPPSEGIFARSAPAEASGQFALDSLRGESFDWHTALSLALASKLVYEDPAAIQNTVSKWGFQSCQLIEADNTRCFLAAASDVALVSFRGTDNVGNWLANLDVLSTTRGYGTVHRGFLGAFQVVDDQVRNALRALNTGKLLLTGHSLGGALATIAAGEWQGVIPISWIYTYGQPAVGRGTFPAFIALHYAGQ